MRFTKRHVLTIIAGAAFLLAFYLLYVPSLDRESVPALAFPILKQLTRSYRTERHTCNTPSENKRILDTRYNEIHKIQRSDQKRTYFIAMNLYNNEAVIPFMIRELARLIDFLGIENVFISVYENGSKDKTPELLGTFGEVLLVLNVSHKIVHLDHKTVFTKENRIPLLSEIRNRAIDGMFNSSIVYDYLLFFNDSNNTLIIVYFCRNDPLELIYQSYLQKSDIACGMDFTWDSANYYDNWVGRSMSGSLVRRYKGEITFKSDPESRWRYSMGLPIQVYSCWNGLALLNAEPFYKHDVRFRAYHKKLNECAASECKFLSKDYWELGYGIFL